jgi:hypothetical protein
MVFQLMIAITLLVRGDSEINSYDKNTYKT